MQILIDSNSVAVFPGQQVTLTAECAYVGEAQCYNYNTGNASFVEAEVPQPPLSNVWQWSNNAWVCTNQQAVDDYYAAQKTEFNKQQSNGRLQAYTLEADGIYFKWQRGEATQQEWLDKVAEIQARYPYQT